MKNKITIFWFRRDLRLEDNIGLHYALKSGFPVLPIFIFDVDILNQLENKNDRRVDYINQALTLVNSKLKKYNSKLNTYFGKPIEIFKTLAEEYEIKSVFCNEDYEPKAIKRDSEIYHFFKTINIPFKSYKDQVIFDKSDILKNDGTPYTIYTPYAKKWRENLHQESYKKYDVNYQNFYAQKYSNICSLKKIGFKKTDIVFIPPKLDAKIINEYTIFRNFPAINGTSQLGIALRFGTISIRKCVAFALEHNQTWLSELIWREFFMQILYHFPNVINQSFKTKYNYIKWVNNENEYKLWCDGKTGYPLVDAGMRQLNKTGFLHNRIRMVVGSFLCKHLLIDWRWGETYFSIKLNDYDLSANNGNWQWVAGCGCDAAPYFRMFNPIKQTEKFDKNLEYIKKWLPEYGTKTYPKPIIEHSFARDRFLKVFKNAVK